MITEDYVSFETAELLKEKGFDWKCEHCYDVANDNPYSNANYQVSYPKPTLQMAMKWLREVHKLFVFVSTWLMQENNVQYYFEIREIKTSDFETLYAYTSKKLNSFEKIAEAGIKYCLEDLI